MHETENCQRCARPTGDGARLCMACHDTLTVDLRQVRELIADLLVTRTKQDAINSRQARVSGSRERPLGFRPGAMVAADELAAVLRFWARTMAAAWAQRMSVRVQWDVEPLIVPDDAEGCATWLLRHPHTIRLTDGAADMVDQIGYAIGKARRTTDRAPEKVYAGRCECGVDLYARENAAEIVCQECRRHFRTADRRSAMLDALREHIATAADIANGAGELFGRPLNRKTINQWHTRDRLLARRYTAGGDPMFRIGDVLDLAVASSTPKSNPVAQTA